ncbi:amino acid adenylation domain-containing protein [Dactylosporangium sp. NPDC000555]|uniref:amino acid adenylation domain-containing protein n=1 Tax=Dactylosporangium sp. NPDC000555 TaxID=3154260 RepID=UPI00331CDBDF
MTTTSVDMFAQPDLAAQQRSPRPVDLPTKFARFAAVHPDAVALRWNGRPWSFATLARRAERYAALLRERIPPGGWLALCAGRSPEIVALVLGAFQAGRAVVPLEPEHPVARLRLTLEDARPALLVTDHTAARELTLGYEADKALLDELAAEAVLFDTGERLAPDENDIAYVIYTSGSTGQPKGVMVQHRQLAQFAHIMRVEEPAIRAGDTVLSVASLAFDMMLSDIFAPLANGATVVLLPGGTRQREPSVLLECIETHQVDTVCATPSLLQMLVLAGLGTDRRRRVRAITGGEALGRELAATLLQRCSRVYQGYGPTETTVLCSFHRVEDPGYLPLGKPSAGTTYYPVDEQLDIVPLNVRAELAIGGDMVAAGYHNRARLTAERFRPDPYADVPGTRCYLSGDLVRVDSSGGAMFAGRKDTQVKIRSHRVELGEVEAALLRQPGVRQCVATAAPDHSGNTELVAYLVGDADTAELRARLRDELPSAMVPSRFLIVESIPLTVNGKPDRDALLNTGPAEQAQPDSAPVGELEAPIAQMWADVLGVESVGADDDFFDLGGHSLLAMEIVARIRGEFGVDLPVWELFTVPTVRAWAVALAEAMLVGTGDDAGTRSAPVTFAQAALCVAEQVVPGVTAPGLVAAAQLLGPVDVGELLTALQTVLDRHEMLRVRFELRGTDSVQIIEPSTEIDFEEAVTTGPADTLATVRRWAERPFDLAAGPLFRALLVEEADSARALYLSFHDAICDAASAAIVLSDLAAVYGTALPGATPQASADAAAAGDAVADGARMSFTDLARAQRGQGSGAAVAELVGQWRARLPRAATRRTGSDHSTATRRITLSEEQYARLRKTAEQHDIDLAALLLDRLHAATGAQVGALVLGGRGDGTQHLVGPLASTLLVPFTGTGPDNVRDDVAWALSHAVPAEMLALQPHGGERLRSVPDVVVAARPPQAPITCADRRTTLVPLRPAWPDGPSPARTGVVASLEFVDEPSGELPLMVQYRPDLLDEAALERLLGDL